MTDVPLLRTAIDTAWSVYRATHPGVLDGDHRLCLLERPLQGKWEAHCGNSEELTGLGIRLSTAAFRREMLRRIEALVCRMAYRISRPDWTLLAASYAASAAVISARSALFG
ncbi:MULTISPECIES: hypothetical protein [unclassified Bradyrhizobium]|uniref:hypothetical protein n=1 Tax=unclassified Bradyrhizobium TaxID=2631580 RepID=UPI002012274E|nr:MULTISPECIES: hypothetical protein [unclassified Bradyrhizobium]